MAKAKMAAEAATQFKVGDVVICPRVPDNRNESPGFTGYMDELVGQEMTLDIIGSDGDRGHSPNGSPNGWWWNFKWLVHATPAAKAAAANAAAAMAKAANAQAKLQAKMRAKLLAGLSPAGRRVATVFAADKDAFGCQRGSVRALVEAILGCKLPPED